MGKNLLAIAASAVANTVHRCTILSYSIESKSSLIPPFASLPTPQIYSVAVITVANGGDNIGIYEPLFASATWVSFGVILGVFYLLIAIWCLATYFLSHQPAIAHVFPRYGNAIVPFVLIGLGIYILLESDTYRLLPQFN